MGPADLIHDGTRPGEGGIEAWLRLGEAVGLAREALLDERHVLPGVRRRWGRTCDSPGTSPGPLRLRRRSPNSLHRTSWPSESGRSSEYYTWVPGSGLDYFRSRLTQARTDSDEGLHLTLSHCTTPGASGAGRLGLGAEVRDPLVAARCRHGRLRGGSGTRRAAMSQAAQPWTDGGPPRARQRGCDCIGTGTTSGRSCYTPKASSGPARRGWPSSPSATGAGASMRSLPFWPEKYRREGEG